MSARPTRRPTARRTRRLLAGLTTAAVALVAPAVLAPAAHADTAADLFISEYVEGSSNNKALEIFNGTGGSIDLAAGGYVVQVFASHQGVDGVKVLAHLAHLPAHHSGAQQIHDNA